MANGSSTRENLLKAAKTVLVDPEYEGFTTAAVAEEAGRNQALIHYYFDTKHDLVIELFEYLQEEAAEELATVADENDPADRLVALLSILLWADPTEADGPSSAEEAIEFKRGLLWLNAQAAYDPDLREATAADLKHFWTALRPRSARASSRESSATSIRPRQLRYWSRPSTARRTGVRFTALTPEMT